MSQAMQIVRWAVGPADRPAPAVETLDEEALESLAAYHRIDARLLARLEAARPAWCPPRLLTRLRIRQHHTRQTVQTKIAAACEISRASRQRGLPPPIFVKGFAAYALAADPELVHYSGDLDLFAQDLPALESVLHDLGYTGKRKDTHEWAKLRRGEITLDLHQYFPSLAYPPEVRALPAARLDARQNPGHWALPAPERAETLAEAKIRWKDLEAGAVPGAAAGTEEVLFPSPTLLCLIHCAHCFRVCMTRLHYMDLFGGFRLYELLSVYTLARLPGFDAAQFEALTVRFSAQDAVRLVNSLAEATFGAPAVAGLQEERGSAFPEQLIYGGWVSLQETDDWLWPRGITEMIEQLGANAAPASCRLDTRTARRLLTQGANPPAFQIAVHWNAAQKSVTLDWTIYEVAAEHELLVHFGYGSVIKTRLDCAGEVVSVVQKSDYGQMDAPAAAEAVSGSVRLTCAVPAWPGVSATSPDLLPDSLPLFLAVRRLSGDGCSTEAASYLPLRLLSG